MSAKEKSQTTGEKDAKETVRVICECVNNLLTDLNAVTNQLKTGSDGTMAQVQTVLLFLHHCTDAFADCYIVRGANFDNEREVITQKSAKCFTFWVLSRLLRIIASPGCISLHNKTVSTMEAILQLARTRDICFYQEMVEEMIGLYQDALSVIEDYIRQDENPDIFTSKMFSTRFQKTPVKDVDLSIAPKLIELSSYDHCQNLLTVISAILKSNIIHIHQFVNNSKMTLCNMCFHTVQTCDEVLKMATVQFLNEIMQTFTELPSTCMQQYMCVVYTTINFQLDNGRIDKDWDVVLLKSVDVLTQSSDLCVFSCTLFTKRLISHNNDKLVDRSPHNVEFLWCALEKLIINWQSKFAEDTSNMLLRKCFSCIQHEPLVQVVDKCLLSIMENFLKHDESVHKELKENINRLSSELMKNDNFNVLHRITLLLKVSCKSQLAMQGLLQIVESLMNQVFLMLRSTFRRKDITSKLLSELYPDALDFLYTGLWMLHKNQQSSKVHYQKCCDFCVLPWLKTIDPPWFDFKPIAFKEDEFLKLSMTLKLCFTSQCIMNKCLKLLSLLTMMCDCPTWFAHIVRTSLSSNSLETQKSTVKYFPLFLTPVGVCSNALVTDELLALARLPKQDDLLNAIGATLEKVVCVLGDQVEHKLNELQVDVECAVCDKGLNLSGSTQDLLSTLKPFFQLLKHNPSLDYKHSLVRTFRKIINHLTNDRICASKTYWLNVLDLVQDYDAQARFSISFVLGDCMKRVDNIVIQQLVIASLSSKLSKASEINDTKVVEAVLVSMGAIGRNSKDEFLLVILMNLFSCFVSQSRTNASIASSQICKISTSLKFTLPHLFTEYKNHFCDISVKQFQKLLEDGKDINCITDILFDISKLFKLPNIKSFLLRTSTEILPKIVIKASPHSSTLLRLFAKHINYNRREMMFYNFKYIFSYLVRNITKRSDLEACLRYLQEETDVELTSLLLSEYQSVFNQLLLYISVNREQVVQGFSILACNDASYKGPKDIKTDSDLALFLHHRLLGVLAFFNSVLSNSPNYERKIALSSILCLLNIMGSKYLTPVRLKVMAILKLTLRFKDDFPQLCCAAWDCFVRNIDVECLEPLLGQLIATLLLLLDTCASQVASIFHFLIIENREVLSPSFKDIYFIPEHHLLKRFKDIIESNQPPVNNMNDFKTLIQYICNSITNENKDVRKFALAQLSKNLEVHFAYLNELLDNPESIDPIVVLLVNTLLRASKETHCETYETIAICFGKLGAIDPGRIENNIDNFACDSAELYVNIKDEQFAYELIKELCRAFLAANSTRAQDCAAFAIQETLQFYECTNQPCDKVGYLLWQKFSKSTQELLLPHLFSKYINATVYNWSKHSLPLYGSSKGKSYEDWTSNWTNYMTYFLEDSSGRLFKPCMSIIKHDLKIALFLLPAVVYHAIISRKADCVRVEFLAVLKACTAVSKVTEFAKGCTQIVFSVFDSLNICAAKLKDSESRQKDMNCIKEFVESIPKNLLSHSSFQCNALFRSLMFYEQHMELQNTNIEEHLEFLQKLYSSLDEPDGISGITATRHRNTTIQEQIVEHESSGNFRDAIACYERAIQVDGNQVDHHKGLLQCLISLGQLHNALMDVSGVIEKRPEWQSELEPYQAEISWRLGQWDTLKKSVSLGNFQSNWSLSVGRLLLCVKERSEEDFKSSISLVRSEQMHCLRSASLETGAYQRAYKSILHLHMLEDVERYAQMCWKDARNPSSIKQLLSLWSRRLHSTEFLFQSREPLLHLRRILLTLLPNHENLQTQQDNGWLMYSRIARKAGLFQTAYSSLLNVNDNNHVEILIEKAKWYSSQNNLHKALLTLQKESTSLLQTQNQTNNKLYEAKVSLLKAKWMEETESYEPELVLTQYKTAVKQYPNWEKGHFYLAKYYEKLMSACDEHEAKEDRKMRKIDFIKFVIKHFGESLHYGSKYIDQSMPRLFTLWLDFGVTVSNLIEGPSNVKASEKSYYRDKLQRLNEDVLKFSKLLPAYQFLTAYSQLVSRICHPNISVWKLLEVIICKVFHSYKHQAIWSLVAVSKSSVLARGERCKQVFHTLAAEDSVLVKFIGHALDLTDKLLEICNRRCGKESKLSMSRDFASLTGLVNDKTFSQIMVPLQSTLTVKLPSSRDSDGTYKPFPYDLPVIRGFVDQVDVLSSLQKPKKIQVKASDGNVYMLMCKPKDDLRKDGRLMEFNSLVNKLLLRDPACRSRQLHIRTYAVIPLNEECGLLEWVPNTTALRYILNKTYREKGMVVKVQELKQLYEPLINTNNVKTKMNIFVQRILPRYPPVFHEWFLANFSDPTKWYMARLAYSRTSAVISMVGYTLGLGDRHGENILFDSVCGDCVHVDFNCLFNKGETFDCPERVPFRLTRNMVKAMGPLGYEGVFRKSCEVTMKLMREQKDSLLSVLNTFVYDPLLEWKKESLKKSTNGSSNEMALKILKLVEHRLSGYINSTMIHLPLSIEGQVHQLIKESTSIENLSQMYIGWAAYM